MAPENRCELVARAVSAARRARAGSDKSLDLVRNDARKMWRHGTGHTSVWAGTEPDVSLHPGTVIRRKHSCPASIGRLGNDQLSVRPKRGRQSRCLCSIGFDFPP
jgi:hypothetical protein